ncbi:MAG: hypothetical protein K2X87_19990 [Gemmataceae bacterium]|nr:hypothetical protein [Gemmataceae bacterium]
MAHTELTRHAAAGPDPAGLPAVPGVTDEPVLRLLLDGRATSQHEAEELYLDAAPDEIGRLVAGPLDNDALLRHPLMQLLAAHGGRGWEDSPVTADERLAEVVTALEAVGVRALVMGGHAVRYYGLYRNTDEFDLHLAPNCWDDLAERLARSDWFRARSPVEGPSGRAHAFRRFQVGVLASGREEWLEFWKGDHLLPPFEELYARRETGPYGGRACDFLALPDLIRAKETERERDWRDIQYPEEFLDARNAAAVRRGEMELTAALGQLRSRRGFETHLLAGRLANPAAVRQAIARAATPMAASLLLPSVADAPEPPAPVESAVVARLRTTAPGSPLLLTLVEADRRRYKQVAVQADKAEEAVRAARQR